MTRPLGKTTTEGMKFIHMKSTTTAIDDNNRWRKKIGPGCSWEATPPPILFLMFPWLNIHRHLNRMTITDSDILAKILPGNQNISQNLSKNYNVNLRLSTYCHKFDSWSLHKWNVWLVLMCQVTIVDFAIFTTFASLFPARTVSRAWTNNSQTDILSNCFYKSLAIGIFRLPWIKQGVFFCILTIAPLLIDHSFAITIHYTTDLVSTLCLPTIFLSMATTFVCTSAKFVNASWQSAGSPWWYVIPLFSNKVLWTQYLQIIFDFNGLDMVQIFKSMLKVINL